MRTSDLSRREALFGCLVLGAAAGGPTQAATAAGTVRALSGEARAAQRAQERALAQDDGVFVGDRVWTGEATRARILLGAATDLRMGAHAEIRIDRFLVNAGGVVSLDAGSIGVDRDPGRGGGALSIRSPYGLIAVRGTRFFAGRSNGVFGVFVERGSVAVTGGGRSVVLDAGQGTDIAAPGDAPSAPRTWGAPRIAAAWASVR